MKKLFQQLFVFALSTIFVLAMIIFMGAINVSPIVYLLRDGLGPDAPPPSEGFEAIKRMLSHPYYSGALFGSLALLLLSGFTLKICGYWQGVRSYFRLIAILGIGFFAIFWVYYLI